MSSTVSIVACNNYYSKEVYGSMKDSVDRLGGMERFVKKGERILLKPNLLTAKEPDRAATTHPSVVEAAIRLVRETGAVPVVGDSPALGNGRKVAEKAGVLKVCESLGVEFVDFKETFAIENPSGRFKSLIVAKEVVKADGIINLPKIKTHAQMFLTLCVKNMFGCVVGRRKASWHLAAGRDRMAFARLLLEIYNLLKPRLNIADGITVMEGNGPGSGLPRHLGLIVASCDGVAMDRVITEILGAKAQILPTVRLAMDEGMNLNYIETVGKGIDEIKINDFKFPPQMDVEWSIPEFFKKRLKKSLTPRPVVNTKTCTLCGLCVETCPAGIMEVGKKKIYIDYDLCIRCFCCQEICREGAIVSMEGWIGRLLIR